MRRALLLLPLTVLLVAGCTVPPGTGAPGGGAPGGGTTATWVDEMVGRINAERAAVGVAPVQPCASLMTAAQRHSEDQAAHSKMSHTGSDGSTMSQRAGAAGYLGWNALAENVAAGQPDVTAVMDAWMGSSGHRTNLLSPTYEHVGVGRAAASSGTPYWTQDFGRRGSC